MKDFAAALLVYPAFIRRRAPLGRAGATRTEAALTLAFALVAAALLVYPAFVKRRASRRTPTAAVIAPLVTPTAVGVGASLRF